MASPFTSSHMTCADCSSKLPITKHKCRDCSNHKAIGAKGKLLGRCGSCLIRDRARTRAKRKRVDGSTVTQSVTASSSSSASHSAIAVPAETVLATSTPYPWKLVCCSAVYSHGNVTVMVVFECSDTVSIAHRPILGLSASDDNHCLVCEFSKMPVVASPILALPCTPSWYMFTVNVWPLVYESFYRRTVFIRYHEDPVFFYRMAFPLVPTNAPVTDDTPETDFLA